MTAPTSVSEFKRYRKNPVPSLSRLPSTAQLLIVLVSVMILAEISLLINFYAQNVTVIWLPNAFVFAILFLRQKWQNIPVLFAHFLAIFLSNVLNGTSVPISTGFAVINSLDLVCVSILHKWATGNQWPHFSEQIYLRFVAMACVPTAFLTGLFGAALLHMAYALPFLDALVAWIVGEAISLAAFIPFFIWLLAGGEQRLPDRKGQYLWLLLTIVLTILCLSIAPHYRLEVEGLMLLIAALTLLGLKLGRVGAIWTTAILVISISLTSYLERNSTDGESALQIGKAVYAFFFVFLCTGLPVNLIATMIERLGVSERTQRDIATLKSEFISTMSHEIKTPMNAIHGMFELFNMSDLTPRQRSWAAAGLSASKNLQIQVTQILEMSSLEENVIHNELEAVNLRQLVENWGVALEANILAIGSQVKTSTHVAPDLPEYALLQPARTQQILNNLISNAVKFCDSGTIGISALRDAETLVIKVQDTGIGIGPEHLDSVFQRFFQVESGAKRKIGGTGLGLSISQRLAILIGGDLRVSSKLGVGSTFTLLLPLIPTQPTESKDPST